MFVRVTMMNWAQGFTWTPLAPVSRLLLALLSSSDWKACPGLSASSDGSWASLRCLFRDQRLTYSGRQSSM